MIRRLFFSVLFLLIFQSCASVNSFIKERDFSGAANFCNQKTGKDKEACFVLIAERCREATYYVRSYDTYMKLGNDTGKKAYFLTAGDLADKHLDPLRAFKAYDAAGDIEVIRRYTTKKSTEKNWKTRNIHLKEIGKIAEKYQFKNVFANLGEIALADNHPKEAGEYYKRGGNAEKANEIYLNAGDTHYKRDEFSIAAEYYTKAGRSMLASEAYIKSAEKQLAFKYPYYTKILELYKKQGRKSVGRKLWRCI